MRTRSFVLFGAGTLLCAVASAEGDGVPRSDGAAPPEGRPCPSEMVHVNQFCIDRYEASMVDRESERELSPFYPPLQDQLREVRDVWEVRRFETGSEAARAMPLPDLPEWQRTAESWEPKAVSRPGTIPAGYLSWHVAKSACEAADKRLCSEPEWVRACEGAKRTRFPYGSKFERRSCNVYRYHHPAHILHGDSSSGHRDPRLNLVVAEGEDPVLRLTGSTQTCASTFGDDAAMDMVGNLDEWLDDPSGVFVGGFYARATTKGCSSRISNHAPSYYDYSTGVRCCAAAKR